MALRSMRRDQENQIATKCQEHAVLYWAWSASSHTGQQHVEGGHPGGDA